MSAEISANAIGARIRALRESAHLSQRQLADQVGCSKSAVCGIEAGRSMPSLPLAKRLATALNVTIDDIARGDR